MFDSVLRPDFSQNRFGAGVVVAVTAHALLATMAVMLSRPHPKIVVPPPDWRDRVKLYDPVPLGRTASPQKSEAESRRPRRRDLSRPVQIMPTVLPTPSTPESIDVGKSDDSGEAFPRGSPDGVPGAILRDSSPVTAVRQPARRIELDEGDVRLKKISGPDPEYTQQALDHEVEGTIVTKCVVTPHGMVERCRILKSLPFMDRSVIDALERRRYEPYRLNGAPVEVDYIFRIRLQLPR